MHTHNYQPSVMEGFELCQTCCTYHNLTPYPREKYLEGYWDNAKGRSTLEEQRYNVTQVLNDNGESKIGAVLKHLKPGSLLEIGCAPGSLLKEWSEQGHLAEGIEPDDNYAGLISEYSKSGVHIGFFEDIQFEHKFTNIVALDILEHVSDPESFIDKALELLEDGGRLVLMIPTAECAREQDWCEEHIHLFSEKYLHEWLKPTVMEVWLPGHCVIVVEK